VQRHVIEAVFNQPARGPTDDVASKARFIIGQHLILASIASLLVARPSNVETR
jgi:hypothetical protein